MIEDSGFVDVRIGSEALDMRRRLGAHVTCDGAGGIGFDRKWEMLHRNDGAQPGVGIGSWP